MHIRIKKELKCRHFTQTHELKGTKDQQVGALTLYLELEMCTKPPSQLSLYVLA